MYGLSLTLGTLPSLCGALAFLGWGFNLYHSLFECHGTFVEKSIFTSVSSAILLPFGGFGFDVTVFLVTKLVEGQGDLELELFWIGVFAAAAIALLLLVANLVKFLIYLFERYERYVKRGYANTVRRYAKEILTRKVGNDVGGVIVSYCFE